MVGPFLESSFDLQLAPEIAKGRCKLLAVWLVLTSCHRQLEGLEWRHDSLPELLQAHFELAKVCLFRRGFGLLIDPNGLMPGRAAPPSRQRFIFETIDVLLFSSDQSCFESGEPLLVLPLEHQGAQRAASQFSERMMRD